MPGRQTQLERPVPEVPGPISPPARASAPRRTAAPGPLSILDSLVSLGPDRPEWIWRNGGLVPWHEALVHVNAVGQASVAAVFEGIKAYRSHDGEALLLFRLDEHMRRLHDSARICRLDLPYSWEELTAAAVELVRANGFRDDVYLRPWAFPAGFIQEQLVPADIRCEVVIDSWPFQTGFGQLRGCRAGVSSWLRTPDAAAPPRVKAFSNYHNGRLAMIEARENGHDWPILLNDRHKVSEGPGACIALVRGGVVATPSLTSSVLESITRDTVLALLAEMGVPAVEREVDRSELYLADEVFFMGTGWEILPVVAVDGLAVGTGRRGPVTERIELQYARVVRGQSPEHASWLTKVELPAPESPQGVR
jgi:branched-chain amino acid aminotransferase